MLGRLRLRLLFIMGRLSPLLDLSAFRFSARNANHVGRAWPGQSCFVRGVARVIRGSSRCTVVSVIGRAYQ
jgi:hypothetical protein